MAVFTTACERRGSHSTIRKIVPNRCALVAAVLPLASVVHAQSTTLYWDPNGTTGGTALNGTWDVNNTTAWAATNALTASPAKWADGGIAIFSAGAGATGTSN